jgi:hypothetical protein
MLLQQSIVFRHWVEGQAYRVTVSSCGGKQHIYMLQAASLATEEVAWVCMCAEIVALA